MDRQHSLGFTLIELVIVIMILGITAVIATPRFISLQRDARIASLHGVAGQLREQNSRVYMRALLDGIAEKSSCAGLCGGNRNWDPGSNAGYFFVKMADGSKIYVNYGYPFTTGADSDDTLDAFKAGMGLSDNDFIVHQTYPLKIVPRQWENKSKAIQQGQHQCHIEFKHSTASAIEPSVIVYDADC